MTEPIGLLTGGADDEQVLFGAEQIGRDCRLTAIVSGETFNADEGDIS
jgi:hypothetical protein